MVFIAVIPKYKCKLKEKATKKERKQREESRVSCMKCLLDIIEKKQSFLYTLCNRKLNNKM